MNTRHTFYTLALLFLWWGVPLPTHALVEISDPVLTLTPPTPEPFSEVTVEIADRSIVPPGGRLDWYVDGVERVGESGQAGIMLTTGSLSSTTVIEAVVTTNETEERRLQARITPVRTDLIVAANNRTPNFYRGRSLPSESSEISVRALVFSAEPTAYTYAWRINGTQHNETLGGSSDIITFRPGLSYELNVSVEVRDSLGRLMAADSVRIRPVEPELYFYESNPLRGLQPNALPQEHYWVKDEITLRGEPYYMSGSPRDWRIRWQIDSAPVESDTNPLELSLLKTFEVGNARIGLDLLDIADHQESAESYVDLTY